MSMIADESTVRNMEGLRSVTEVTVIIRTYPKTIPAPRRFIAL